MAEKLDYTMQEERAFRRISWTWAKAVDTKDWALLASISTDHVDLKYSKLSPLLSDEIRTRQDYVEGFMKPKFEDVRLKTQHLLGEVLFTLSDENHAVGSYQCFVRHIRRLANGEVAEWTSSAFADHFYKCVDGQWKFAGIQPHSITAEVGTMTDVFGDFE